jgi:hypothetical protein
MCVNLAECTPPVIVGMLPEEESWKIPLLLAPKEAERLKR